LNRQAGRPIIVGNMTTIAFVGVAHIHTPGFIGMLKKRAERFRVGRVYDPHAARGQQRATELGATYDASVEAIVNDRTIPAVVVCSETHEHEQLVARCAAAGKHLFVEKPLGMRADDAYRMSDAIEAAGVLFQTGYFMRGNSNVLAIRRLVQEGWFGQITRVRAANCHQGALAGWFDAKPNDPANDWRWMADPKRAGVGAFGDLGTHVLDLMLWMFGPAASVTATTSVGTNRYDGCDETGEGTVVFESGVIGTLAAAWDDVHSPTSLMVSGTKGFAAITDGKLHLQHADKQVGVVLGETQPSWPHAFELWLDAVAGKADVPLVGPREAAYRSAVMEAMYEAAANRTWVKPKQG